MACWDLRTKIEKETNSLGIDPSGIFIIDPNRFKNDVDGPCHSDKQRLQFWTDVLKSLHLSYAVLFEEARHINEERRLYSEDDFIVDLEERIGKIIRGLDNGGDSIVQRG